MAKKVLVVEDDLEILNVVKLTLEQGGFEVHACSDGRLAFEEIAKVRPDALVLDVMMPGVDGYSLQVKISQDDSMKSMPIVVLTALVHMETLFKRFKVAAFMTKPFKPEELLATVTEAVAKFPRG